MKNNNNALDAQILKQLLTAPFDRGAWGESMGEDCHLRIGNQAPRIGKAAALPELERFYHGVDAVGAGYCDVLQHRETIVVETEISVFPRKGASYAVVPCAIFARTIEKKLRDIRFYLDPTPLPIKPLKWTC